MACRCWFFQAADDDISNRSFGANFFNRAVSRILKKPCANAHDLKGQHLDIATAAAPALINSVELSRSGAERSGERLHPNHYAGAATGTTRARGRPAVAHTVYCF